MELEGKQLVPKVMQNLVPYIVDGLSEALSNLQKPKEVEYQIYELFKSAK